MAEFLKSLARFGIDFGKFDYLLRISNFDIRL